MLTYGRLLMFLTLSVVPPLVRFFGALDFYTDYLWALTESPLPDAYDFIVVGSGSAGAVVALRLSKNNKVLLLEAGGDPSPLNAIPLLAADLLGHSQTDWMYSTVPQKNACLSFQNQSLPWPRGRVLGGSSTLNYMLYLRGHPLDYAKWVEETGDTRWGYEYLLPYFRKSIRTYKGQHSKDKRLHGESPYGFLHVEQRKWTNLYHEFKSAGKEILGLDEVDINGYQTSGFGSFETTQRNGERWGTYASILRSGASKNLQILKYSQVIKVEMDRKTKTAKGVWYVRHGKKRFVGATKEVILSAGAINSPHILMLSGIGPKAHLKEHRIPVLLDLPVGKNLIDHVMNVLPPFVVNKPESFLPDRDMSMGLLWDYFVNGEGPLTAPNGLVAQAFLSSEEVRKTGQDWPDIQLYFNPVGLYQAMDEQFTRVGKVNEGVIEHLISDHVGKDAVIGLAALVRPHSTGELRLKNSDPLASVIIDPHYLEDPRDIAVLVEGNKILAKLFEESNTFKRLNTTMITNSIPGCENFTVRSDAYWECLIRHLLTTVWHPVGTCRMGKRNDSRSVVDSELRVIGTTNLRVIDASIMPTIVNANTNAPSIMIGEKGSDMIRETWSKHFEVTPRLSATFYTKPSSSPKLCFYSQLV